jgi:hypothetical protein
VTLVVDHRDALGGKPGVHVLIVGVSELPYCSGFGHLAEETFGLRSLEGPAISAQRFLDWLVQRQQHLPQPLATVRLLVSSRNGDALAGAADGSASLEHFLDALYEWRADASTHPGHIAMFYFSGWGFGIGNDVALVLSDFGRPRRPVMAGTVSFDNIYAGMSPSYSNADVATTQFYFIDAGRHHDPRALPYLSSVTDAFSLAPSHRRDLRNAPVFYSSVAGGMPFSRVGGATIFGEVLLACLEGRAAEATEEYRAGQRVWRVSVNSLNAALEREFDKLAAAGDTKGLQQTYALGGIVKDATICTLPEAPPMKALVFSRRQTPDTPGLHVLIAGVSTYRHGRGGHGKPAAIDLGIGQLSAAATSAFRLGQWFIAHEDRFETPLESVRVLLSPSALEIERTPELAGFGDRCTLDNFLAAAAEWRDDAARHPNSVTVFYFAGHGAQRTKGDSILLFEDFGDGVGGPLRKAVDTETVFYGMAPSKARKRIARTQLYFIDACRVRPAVFKNYRLMHTTPIFEIEEVERDDRHAPVFYAAASGSQAYAVPGEHTTFGRILLDVLARGNHAANDVRDSANAVISVRSLDTELQAGIEESNKRTGADQEYSLEGIAKDAIVLSWRR